MSRDIADYFDDKKLDFASVASIVSLKSTLTLWPLMACTIGVALDAVYGMQWLNRMGAMVTMTAVITLMVYVRHVKEESELREISHKLHRDFLVDDPSRDDPDDRLVRIEADTKAEADERADAIHWFLKNLPDRLDRLKSRNTGMLNAQVLWGSIGTLVWAFADLFTNRLLHCGEWQC